MPIKDPEARRAYQREWVRKRREAYFKDKFCVECGSTERLELDHIDRKTKISNRIWSWSEERRNEELAKCQVLCHDCHLSKTKKEIPEWRGILTCGTFSKYNKGCRCSECTNANKERSREYRSTVR